MVFRYSSVPAPLSASAVMRAAREAGASWAEISAVLGMSKQGAQNLYRRKIADQERYVGGPPRQQTAQPDSQRQSRFVAVAGYRR